MQRLSFVFLLACAGSSLLPRTFAASPDPEKTRQLLAVVQSDAALADRARALQQLALVATADAVPVLAALLADEKLGQYARDGLELLPYPSAGDALRAALGRLRGNALVGVVNSLGVRRDAQAVDALSRLAADRTSGAAGPALLALGHIATPEAGRVVEQALVRGPAELRPAAAEACLLVADRLVDEGKRASGLALYEAVRRAELPEQLRVTATRGSILARETGGLALLLEQLRSGDPAMQDVALLTIRDLREPRVTPTLVAELDKLPPVLQARLIAVLVERGEAGAVEAVEARAAATNDEVRLAALRALGKIGRASSVPILLQAVRPPSSPAVAAVAGASLSRIAAPETNGLIQQALSSAEPAIRVRLIGVLGERKADSATSELMKLAENAGGETSKAAFRALGLVSRPGDLPRLIQLAIAVQDDDVKTLADRAIVTTAMKVLEPGRRAEAVLTAFRQAADPATKRTLLRPLGAIVRSMGGSHEVFFAVRAALQDPGEGVRAAALRCLADWPDATPANVLLEFIGPDVPAAQREVALRGAMRMATDVAAGRERSPLNVLECFVRANRVVRTKEEKLMVISGLGNLKRPEAVAMLQPYLDDPAVQAEAALAVVQIAPALAGVKSAGALKGMLEKIAATDKDEEVRRKAARLAQGGPAQSQKGKAAALAAPAGSSALFNGLDLGGWDGDPAVWRVRDGAIVGGSLDGNPRNEFLATTRRYRNFVLRVEYRLVGAEGFVNSGVQFRSVRVPQPPNEMSGYQADIGAGHSGCLYDESRRKKFLARATDEQIKRLEQPGGWNRYEIRCVGPRVELTLNGEETVTFTEDDPSVAPDGLIALQIHGNCKAEVSFRNLVIEELP